VTSVSCKLTAGLPAKRLGLLPRIGYLALLFSVEVIVLSTWLDTATLARRVGLVGAVGDWGPPAVRAVIAAAAVFVTFAYLTQRSVLRRVSAGIEGSRVAWSFLACHFGLLAVFGVLSSVLFATRRTGIEDDFLAGIWLIAGILLIISGTLAFVPPRAWVSLLRATGMLWVYAGAAGILAYASGTVTWLLWKPAMALTFNLSKLCLQPFVSGLIADPATKTLGTKAFSVAIHPTCSGLEGAGLMLVFGASWLLFFRRECRFPQAILLIPVGIILVWLLNVVRIAALILIGNAGAPNVALGGFHSSAGWIAFTVVALSFSIGARKVAWLSTIPGEERGLETSADNPTEAYLVPILMILAAGMVSRAVSGGFEWLYPLRFLAGAAALWCYRSRYASLDWRAGWLAPVIGLVVFVIWLALDLVGGRHTNQGLASALAASPAWARVSWIAIRTLAAVVTVPLAEELAFRGFLLRRLVSRSFELVSFGNLKWLPVLASSLAFGLLHGDRWLAGTVAGILYAITLMRNRRFGDAVVAHATTNALLATWVLVRGDWYLW